MLTSIWGGCFGTNAILGVAGNKRELRGIKFFFAMSIYAQGITVISITSSIKCIPLVRHRNRERVGLCIGRETAVQNNYLS